MLQALVILFGFRCVAHLDGNNSIQHNPIHFYITAYLRHANISFYLFYKHVVPTAQESSFSPFPF